jgi:molecular chaperone DnaK
MAKIIGIDLGTTNSAVAIMEGGVPKIIENLEGARTTPSVVSVSKNGDRTVGAVAKRQAVMNPKDTIYGVKRYMGHEFTDKEVSDDVGRVSYEVKKGANNGVLVNIGGKDMRPEEISAMILQKIKADVEAKTGEKITEAVITVPAYFNDAQRQATKDAGAIAGLDVKRIINEPTAAALAYGFTEKAHAKLAVYDFGGGTFDISILEMGDGVVEVKATGGDSHLGGRDIDIEIVSYIKDQFKKETGIDLSSDSLAMQRLDEAAEKAKHELSTQVESKIFLPYISVGAEGPKNLDVTLTRAQLENIARSFVERSIKITEQTLKDSGISKEDINEIIMVGGQTRMPMIVEAVKNLFGKEPNRSVNPDEVVALGAAVQAGVLQGDVKDVLLLDVIPLSLGIETMGNVATKLVEKNTTIPTSRSQTFSTAADNQTSVEIHIVQGERPMAPDNKSLGRFILDGIPPAPRGMPQVEVTFDVDANGILNVKAKDKTSGKEQTIRIEASSGLSKEEIAKMQQDAEANAGEDAKKKEFAEAKNTSDQLMHTAEKSLHDAGDKVPAEVKAEILADISELKQAKESGDIVKLNDASAKLNTSMMKIGEAMKQANDANTTNPAEANPSDANPNEAATNENKTDEASANEGGENNENK